MNAEEQKQDDRIKKLEDGQEEIMKLLRPISETYRTVNLMGKWLMAFLVLVSVMLGIIASWSRVVHIFTGK